MGLLGASMVVVEHWKFDVGWIRIIRSNRLDLKSAVLFRFSLVHHLILVYVYVSCVSNLLCEMRATIG